MDGVVDHLQDFSDEVATGATGALGLLFTVATCFYLLYTIEGTFNAIWHVSARRTLMRKFMIFYPMVTLVPVLAGTYLYWSGKPIRSGATARFFGPQLMALIRDLEESRKARVGDMTIADLLPK
jgi:uncharacterized BrkB/YihY/UPF0761 family membrane protein